MYEIFTILYTNPPARAQISFRVHSIKGILYSSGKSRVIYQSCEFVTNSYSRTGKWISAGSFIVKKKLAPKRENFLSIYVKRLILIQFLAFPIKLDKKIMKRPFSLWNYIKTSPTHPLNQDIVIPSAK